MPARHARDGGRKVLSGIEIAQAGQSHLHSLGAGLRRVQGQTVERCTLDLLHFREQFIGFGKIARGDRLLSLSFEGGHLRIIARLVSGPGELWCVVPR